MADSSSRDQRGALIALTGLAVGSLADLWADWTADELAEVLEDVSALYGLAAGTLAADWYDQLRAAAGFGGGFITEPARMPTSGLFRSVADKVLDGSPDTALVRAQGEVQRVVANAHRDTITQLSGRDERASGWRRVGDGSNCKFCNMLIGRGAVYKESTARFASHEHCNCMAAPAFDAGRAIGVMPYTRSTRRRSEASRAKDAARVRAYIAAN